MEHNIYVIQDPWPSVTQVTVTTSAPPVGSEPGSLVAVGNGAPDISASFALLLSIAFVNVLAVLLQ